MLFDEFRGRFRKWHQKVSIFDRVYKVFETLGFPMCRNSTGLMFFVLFWKVTLSLFTELEEFGADVDLGPKSRTGIQIWPFWLPPSVLDFRFGPPPPGLY